MQENAGEPLQVSSDWKEKFDLFDKAGGAATTSLSKLNMAALTAKERKRISFNVWAFFFQNFFYFFKKMWAKGFVLWSMSMVLFGVVMLVAHFAGINIPNVVYYFAPGAIFAPLANHDYYMRVVHGQKMWPSLPAFNQAGVVAVIFVVALSFNIAINLFVSGYFSSEIHVEEGAYEEEDPSIRQTDNM